jgi:hypothetical protein
MKKIELRLNPLDSTSQTIEVKTKSDSLYDVVKEVLEGKGIKEDSFTHFHALVNGYSIENDLWKTVKLEDSDTILITPKIQGGNFGQVFKQVAIVAVTIAASAAAPGIVGAGLAAQGLFTAGATIAASLLLNSLIPPPEPGGFGALGSTTAGQDSSQMYNLAGQSNQTKRFGVVPKVFGTFRTYPNVAAASYVDIEADQTTGQLVQVLYVIYDFGLGPTYLEDFQIGTTPLENFADVQYNIVDPNRPDTDEGVWDSGVQKTFTLYKGDVNVENVTFEFTSNENEFGAFPEDYEAIRNSALNSGALAQELTVTFSFPSGLTSLNTNGSRGKVDIEFRIQFRKVGDTTWLDYNDFNHVESFFTGGGLATSTSVAVDNPPFSNLTFLGNRGSFQGPKAGLSDRTIFFNGIITLSYRGTNQKWGYPPGTDTFLIQSGDVTLADSYLYFNGNPLGRIIDITPSVAVPGYDEVQIDTPLVQEIIIYNRVAKDYGFVTDFEINQQFKFRKQQAIAGKAIISANVNQQYFTTIKFTPRDLGEFEVKVTRVRTTPAFTYNVQDRAVWSALTSRFDTSPINTKFRHTFVELKIRATNQLNGRVENFSALATSVLEVYDDVADTWNKELSNNPAWVLAELLTGPVNKRAVSKNRLDTASLLELAEFCEEIPVTPPTAPFNYYNPRHECNFILDYSTSLKDLVNQIGGACQFSLNIVDGKYGVLIDKQRTVPVQIFTPRNYTNFSSTRNYAESPDALEVKYNEPSNNYQLTSLIVYQEGFDETNAVNIDKLETFAITNREQAHRFGKYMIAQNELRQENISITVDFEHLVCTRGDFVQFTQDSMRVGGRPARVTSVSGNRITINDGIDTVVSVSYGYTFRNYLQGIITSTLTVVNSNTFDLDGAIPDVGDLIIIGEVDFITFDCIVKSITPIDNLRANISLIEKADGIYEALETGSVPNYGAQIAAATDIEESPPGEVENLAVIDNSFFFDSQYNYYIDLGWETPIIGGATELFEIYVDNGTGFNIWDSTKELTYRYILPDEDFLGVEHKFKVLAVSSSGQKLNLGEVDFVTATPERKTTPPSDVERLSINITNQVIQLDWDAVPDDDIKDYLIRYSPNLDGTWFTSIPLTRTDRFTVTTSVQARVGTYLIKALDFAGNESVNPALAITSIPRLLELNLIEEIDDFPDLLGTKSQVVTFGNSLILDTLPAGDFTPEGFYNFNSLLDLGDIYTVRLQSLIEAEGYLEEDLMINWDPLSDVLALSTTTTADWDIETQVRYKAVFNVMANWDPLQDVVSMAEGDVDDWTDWTKFTMGDFTGRIFQFRLRLISNVPNVSPRVLDGTIRADMPDRIEQGDNIVSDVLGTDILYDPPFKGPGTTPLIQITQDNASSGDYYTITNKTLEGFTITFYDSSDTAVSRTFDYLAKGFGRLNDVFI